MYQQVVEYSYHIFFVDFCMVINHKSCCYYKTVLVMENLVKMNISAANEHAFGDANVAITKSEKTCSRFI